ncbi:serine/threonine protein phosphatase [bacterium]|nr:serine/threonine protein phosphatase [bacterium]
MTIYAVGDVHGQLDKLEIMHSVIMNDLDPDDINTVVMLGDYIDRGPLSRGVIEFLMGDPFPGCKTVFLKGNHEDMMVRAMYGDHRFLRAWMDNGGGVTLDNYADAPGGLLMEHVDWLDDCPLYYEQYGYVFVHAGIKPGVPMEDQKADDMLWIRDEFLKSNTDHRAIVVHGHSSVTGPDTRYNRINIDTGAAFGGPLTAVKLSRVGGSEFFQV